jgi:DNA-binding PadR family transcriptional regulator
MTDREPAPPLSAQQFQILLTLTDEDRHGYGIIRDVADRTNGAVRLGTGPLYTAIGRLVAVGLLVETDRRDADDARRRYYRLTTEGRQALRAEAARLEGLLAQARRKGIRSGVVRGRG